MHTPGKTGLQYTVDPATLPPAGALQHCSRVRFKVCFSTETFQLVLWHCEHDICGKKEVLAYSELLMLKHNIYKKWTQKVHNLAFFHMAFVPEFESVFIRPFFSELLNKKVAFDGF